MDSTMVAQISNAATQLGMTAKDAFLGWLLVRLGVHLLWALVALFAIWRLTAMVRASVNALKLYDVIRAATGRGNYQGVPDELDYADALAVLSKAETYRASRRNR